MRTAVAMLRPSWNEPARLKALWGPCASGSTETLGTAQKAADTIAECRRRFSDQKLDRWYFAPTKTWCDVFDEMDALIKRSPSHASLGHPGRVSRLREDRINVGYVVLLHPSGYSHETIETCERRLEVVRYHKRIIAAVTSVIIRIESRGGRIIM